jgi:hypothetical protein
MGLWCHGLPVVKIQQSRVPKHLTLIVPYYECLQFFQTQLAHWARYPVSLRNHLSIIVVDDGSPTSPAADAPVPLGVSLRRFRIEQDVRWNWLAARNIGFHHAPEGWCLVTDMDHVVPVETLDGLIHGVHDTRFVYAFSRREHTGTRVHPHSASFLMTRALFWAVGGYDETLSGYYGTDGDFRRRLAKVAPMEVLQDVLERHEYVSDASVTTYQRKQPEDARVQRLIKQRGADWRPKVLSYAYRKVTC